jgi:hypothetical protein
MISKSVYLVNKVFSDIKTKSLKVAVSNENDIFQIAKKPIRDGRLALSELENEFC